MTEQSEINVTFLFANKISQNDRNSIERCAPLGPQNHLTGFITIAL